MGDLDSNYKTLNLTISPRLWHGMASPKTPPPHFYALGDDMRHRAPRLVSLRSTPPTTLLFQIGMVWSVLIPIAHQAVPIRRLIIARYIS